MAKLFKLIEAARLLGISADALSTHIRAGRIRAVNVGAGTHRPRWRVTEGAIEDFVASRMNQPATAKKRRAATAGVTEFF